MKFKYKKIENVTKPKNGLWNIYVNYWWAVTPRNEIIFSEYGSPQCNKDKTIVEHVLKKFYNDCEVRQIETVYLPAD